MDLPFKQNKAETSMKKKFQKRRMTKCLTYYHNLQEENSILSKCA